MNANRATEILRNCAKSDVADGSEPDNLKDVPSTLSEWRNADPDVDEACDVLRKAGQDPAKVYFDATKA